MSTTDAHLASIALGPLTLECDTAFWGGIGDTADRLSGDVYHLLFNHGIPRLLPGPAQRTLNTGEAVVLDEQMFAHFALGQSAGIMHWLLPNEWLHERVASPRQLLGEPMRDQSRWAAALNAFLAQLSGEVIHSGPVAPAILAAQIGTLLALVAEANHRDVSPTPLAADLGDRVKASILERCSDPGITAPAIASSLGISARTMHRALAKSEDTFGGLLMESRIHLAERMLGSPNFRHVSVAEIGKRAGFKDPSHFTKVFRRLRSVSPAEAQRLAGEGSG
ncbi:helix-turn-helix transcriptional regulator [Dyella telluris]|uniref:Helix-turn-helix transcriptional regulator n=1 Tax=Dyella telluris TaxID=2763498 RepID=A0A7G8Q3G6_9GAMM|nr:helix-turn-helix transcriptional regulator [Dyella telluris]QNK01324.1 helix-turn-helix transcriptional regulator [Dyella telluris]